MASEVQQNLHEEFKVKGHIKPGANAAAILKTPTQETEELTKNDDVVVWCGTGDVGRNKTRNVLHHIQSFVEKYRNTNVMVMNVPNRYDLHVDSCVNKEIKTFSRKLCKQLKLSNNAHVMVVNNDRDQFTKHGFHINSKGNEVLAKGIATSVKDILYVKRKDPIIMYWKDTQVLDVSNQHMRRENQENKLDNSKMMNMDASIALEVMKEDTQPQQQQQQHKQFQSEVQPSY
jgi:hypothetical protein